VAGSSFPSAVFGSFQNIYPTLCSNSFLCSISFRVLDLAWLYSFSSASHFFVGYVARLSSYVPKTTSRGRC
jgi:hypothetical protein